MHAREFIYWIQGYFELGSLGADSATRLNEEQVTAVLNHIALVQKCDWEAPSSRAHHFVSWLIGMMGRDTSDGLSDFDIQTIRDKLNNIFYHEVDPSYTEGKPPGFAEMLQSCHDDGRPPSDFTPRTNVFKC